MYGWGIIKTLGMTLYHFLSAYVEDFRAWIGGIRKRTATSGRGLPAASSRSSTPMNVVICPRTTVISPSLSLMQRRPSFAALRAASAPRSARYSASGSGVPSFPVAHAATLSPITSTLACVCRVGSVLSSAF